MISTPVRPAAPEGADELLRLHVAVLGGEPVTGAWRATFRDDLRARLGTDPNLLTFVVPATSALLATLKTRGCTGVELRSTAEGAPLYRSLGFSGLDGNTVVRAGTPGWKW